MENTFCKDKLKNLLLKKVFWEKKRVKIPLFTFCIPVFLGPTFCRGMELALCRLTWVKIKNKKSFSKTWRMKLYFSPFVYRFFWGPLLQGHGEYFL
jgi:hypothetical protein